MKRVFALLLVLLLIAVGGCLTSDDGDDDDDNGDTLGHTVTGRVVDDDGNGIPNVKVTLNTHIAKAAEPPSTYTNDDGYYALTNVSDGNYILTMEKEGYDFDPLGITVNGDNTEVGTTSTSDGSSGSDGHSISGRVTKEGGEGLPNVGIMANIVGAETPPISAVTDSKGNYELTGLADGDYMLLVMADDYTITPATAVVTISGANVTQNFAAAWAGEGDEGVTVSGTITNEDDDPVENVEVEVLVSGGGGDDFYGSTLTDENGEYSILNVPPGDYTLQWSSSSDLYETGSRAITVGSENVYADAVIAYSGAEPGTYTIAGSVFSLDQDPLSGVFAVLTISATQQIHTLTDEYGMYSFRDIPNGTYTVTLTKEGYTITPSSITVTVDYEDAYAGTSQISSGSGETGTHTVSGRVEDSLANGISGVTMMLSDGTDQYTATTGTYGEYVFTEVPSGTYTLTPQSADYEFSPQSQSVNVQADVLVDTFYAASSGGEVDPSDAGGDAGTHEYFPMKRGATWTFLEHIEESTNTLSITGTREFDGKLWWALQHETQDVTVYYRIEDGIVYQYYPTISGPAGNNPYQGTVMNLDLNASPGDSFEFIDFTDAQEGMTTTWKGTATYVGKDAVTVEGGTFSDCMKYVLTVNMVLTVGDYTSTSIMESTAWYAKGVGRVKEAMTTDTNGNITEDMAIELVSYSIP